jgi:hypothetical protein
MKCVEKLFLEQCAEGAFPGGQLVVRRGSQRELDVAVGLAAGPSRGRMAENGSNA